MKINIESGTNIKVAFNTLMEILSQNTDDTSSLLSNVNIYFTPADEKAFNNSDTVIINDNGYHSIYEQMKNLARSELVSDALDNIHENLTNINNLQKRANKEYKLYRNAINKGFSTAEAHKLELKSISQEMDKADARIAKLNKIKELIESGNYTLHMVEVKTVRDRSTLYYNFYIEIMINKKILYFAPRYGFSITEPKAYQCLGYMINKTGQICCFK